MLNMVSHKEEREKYNVEHRHGNRADFNLELYYPCINNESVYSKYNSNEPLMVIINLSETGVRLISKIPLNKGDFISFFMKLDEEPSFWSFVEVEWARAENGIYVAGCQFFALNMAQILSIRTYINNRKAAV